MAAKEPSALVKQVAEALAERVTHEEFSRFAKVTAEATKAHVAKKVSVLEAQIAALTARVAELESRPRGLKYLGVWRAEDSYAPGDTVTDRGSMWIAADTTRERPGESRSWQLAVKAGRDAAR